MTSGDEPHPDAVRAAYGMLISSVRGGRTPEDAIANLRTIVDSAVVDAAVERYVTRAASNRRLVAVLWDPERYEHDPAWYQGPQEDDRYWWALIDQMRSIGYPESALDSIDWSSTGVVGHLVPPFVSGVQRRGLVLGYVQSGKTSNYTAVIAKAADEGYRLVVILAGLTNSLRQQTQARLDTQLYDLEPQPRRWIPLTDSEHDFGRPPPADTLISHRRRHVLIVVKKNKTRLQRLCDWLESAPAAVRERCPTLIIDDEADQASIDTAQNAAETSTINGLIRRLLRATPSGSYLAYTATPFANFFIDPENTADLYPRDFIINLPRPEGYFGPERIFGRAPLSEDDEPFDGHDMIREVPDEDVDALKPPSKSTERAAFRAPLVGSLKEALRYFIIASAVRRARGQTDHSTMLVHTTQFTDVHLSHREDLEAFVDGLRGRFAEGRLLPELRQIWEKESRAVTAEEVGEEPVLWETVADAVGPVLNDLEVIADNYRSTDRLDYSVTDEENDAPVPRTVVVVGGNTLSRGLTLEGLVVSYFVRSSSTYDTLMQMGRWFGYRGGYADLPRIWMTSELEKSFRFLAGVEVEIREEIERYEREGVTPREYGVRVRSHPKLAITSAMKMGRAVQERVSYSNRRVQTILFHHRDEAWVRDNQDAARTLVKSSLADGGTHLDEDVGNGRRIIRDVAAERIVEFLEQYRFHEDSQVLDAQLMTDYIRVQNDHDELLKWSVAVMGRSDNALGRFDIGLDGEVNLINRARYRLSGTSADIKALMSKADRVVDLDLDASTIASMTDSKLQDRRPLGRGLLLLYPIAADSRPTPKTNRQNLDAIDHLVGVGLVFPRAQFEQTTREYMVVELPQEDVEIEEVSIDELDTEADAELSVENLDLADEELDLMEDDLG